MSPRAGGGNGNKREMLRPEWTVAADLKGGRTDREVPMGNLVLDNGFELRV